MKKLLVALLLLPCMLFAQTSNLFISEYGEGSGGNKKYLELYNGTGATVDLANFQIWKGVNGANWGTPLVLTGSIVNGGTYVIANNNVDVIGADMYSTFINFNGDDAMGLAWNGGAGTTFTLLDVFGIEGIDPGTSWTIAGNANASVDKILIRKPTICSPNTDWAAIAGVDAASSEWTIAVEFYSLTSETTDLGMHTTSCAACNTFASFSVTVCNSYTVPSGDETYFASAIVKDTIPNAALCDSILTIDLTITSQITYYADTDADGLGDPNNTTVACSLPIGYVENSDDCDDTNNTIGAATITYYEDADGDTYGSPTSSVVACTQPLGYVLDNTDCNDSDNTIYPGATEICDGLDNDCNGSVDDGLTFINYFIDADGDNYGTGTAISMCANPGAGYATQNGDCNDTDNTIYPGATEICDGLDNDCNGSVDDGLTFVDYFVDADNDNYGTGTAISMCENPGTGYATQSGDCDDTNPNAYPGATEILDNGIDENCDGTDNYLGINENSAVLFSIHPNPSSGLFTVNFNTTVAGTITVTDLNGKVLLEQAVNNETLNLDLSALSNGNYILKITTELGVNQQRIVVQK